MRPTCLDCARKHLAQSLVLVHEVEKGYPEHAWLAVGHMAEAEDELLSEYPEQAQAIRAQRRAYMEEMDGRELDLMGVIRGLTELAEAALLEVTEAVQEETHD